MTESVSAESAAIEIVVASAAAEIAAVRSLFAEYAESLDFDLGFQGFDDELATLPGAYGPPAGRLLLARLSGDAVGTVGLRPLGSGICEMKRLYVRSEYRGRGAGRRLATTLCAAAATLGYGRMRLDTTASMGAAQALYRALNFREIPPYYDNPIDGAIYFERALSARP